MRTGRGIVWAGAVAGALALGAPVAMAAAGPGFTLSPAIAQVDVPSAKPQVTNMVTLSNATSAAQVFKLTAVDFGSLDEEGGVAFLGQSAGDLTHKYGLASWMILDHDTVTVPAAGSVPISVTIDNRSSLAPGGHYGALLATAVTSDGQSGNNVGIKQVLSSLIMVTKEGGTISDLKLVSQSPDGGWWGLPTIVGQRFHNGGNVHVVPWGIVEVKDAAGRVVRRGAINEDSSPILPETFRRFKTPLDNVSTAWIPGSYQVVTTYRYDGSDATKVFTSTVWYVGALVWWLGGLLIAMAVGMLGWWLWLRPRLLAR